jgi:predicted amidophosphoribosyltransferase
MTKLKECPECRQSVSDSAELCPHCGYRLAGRENLVLCPTCNREVLPTVNPHDTISKYCPLCNKPITGLAGRKIFWMIWALVIFGGISLMAVVAFTLYKSFAAIS